MLAEAFSRVTLQEIRTYQAHELHRVKMLMPALCRIRQGRKVVSWEGHSDIANNNQIILFPSGYEFDIANYPDAGFYLAEMLCLPVELIQRFRQFYPLTTPREDNTPGFCARQNNELLYCWEQLKAAVQLKVSNQMLEHMAMGVLLAIDQSNISHLFLSHSRDSLVDRCQNLLLANPGAHWTTQDVARYLFISVSTLRRRLAAEGTSFQKLLDDVRLNNALAAIQSTLKPISVVARDNGYQCPSRFTARFQQRFGITPRILRRASKL
ncbi:helix-turn-helix transcriptional regulator [Salmonella enterica subsp. enterica serovar Oslo]|nr:AraC family transcriptional regulator [Salmonella enterica subsp. enterica serovar Oslo]EDQ0109563.1 helix-turn-helix transcriptional regulator [Salmonella enterica subsp. enterica serovar Oslo]